MKKTLSLFLALVLVLGVSVPAAAADSFVGTTLRLEETSGTVRVKTSTGQAKSIVKNMRLYNGYFVETGASSTAYISLDDTIAVKLGYSSKVQIKQNGKKLEVSLLSGELLSNVTQKLAADQTLDIRTATFVTGIRGTVVSVSTRGVQEYDGSTSTTVFPIGDSAKPIDVPLQPGQKLDVEKILDIVLQAINDNKAPEEIQQSMEEAAQPEMLQKEDFTAMVVEELANDLELAERVANALEEAGSDVSVSDLVESLPELQAAEAAVEQQAQEKAESALAKQEEQIANDAGENVSQVFGNDGDSSATAGGTGSTFIPPVIEDTKLTRLGLAEMLYKAHTGDEAMQRAASYVMDDWSPEDIRGLPDTQRGAISYCLDAEIIHLYEDELYRPNDEVPRAQMAQYLTYFKSGQLPQPDESYQPVLAKIPDVTEDMWYSQAVVQLYQAGVIDAGAFYPNATITVSTAQQWVNAAKDIEPGEGHLTKIYLNTPKVEIDGKTYTADAHTRGTSLSELTNVSAPVIFYYHKNTGVLAYIAYSSSGGGNTGAAVPTFQSGTPKAAGANSGGVSVQVNIDRNATFYWVVAHAGDEYLRSNSSMSDEDWAKSAAIQIASGTGGIASGSEEVLANTDTNIYISGMQPSLSYDIYFVAEDGSGNYSQILKADPSTYLLTASTQPAGYAVLKSMTWNTSTGNAEALLFHMDGTETFTVINSIDGFAAGSAGSAAAVAGWLSDYDDTKPQLDNSTAGFITNGYANVCPDSAKNTVYEGLALYQVVDRSGGAVALNGIGVVQYADSVLIDTASGEVRSSSDNLLVNLNSNTQIIYHDVSGSYNCCTFETMPSLSSNSNISVFYAEFSGIAAALYILVR